VATEKESSSQVGYMSQPDAPSSQAPMPYARIARADCESTVETDRLRSVRSKVERDVWAARQGANVQCSFDFEMHSTQGKSSGSGFVGR
jgi:hypothetical protein